MIIDIMVTSLVQRPLSVLQEESPLFFGIFQEKGFITFETRLWYPKPTFFPNHKFVLIDFNFVFGTPDDWDPALFIKVGNEHGHILFESDRVLLSLGKNDYFWKKDPFNEINVFINRIRSSGQAEAC